MPYDTLPSDDVIEKARAGLAARNVEVFVEPDRRAAMERIQSLIPAGGEVMTGASVTLEEIGFVELLKSGNHPWKNLKDAIVAETDKAKQSRLRKEATLSEYFLGSVHAVTEEGEVIVASNTGSQLPAYAFSSPNVIWVIGTQKIVPTLDEGMKRLKEYVIPLEDQHMKDIGYGGTNLSKLFMFFKETLPTRKIRAIFVKEKLGF